MKNIIPKLLWILVLCLFVWFSYQLGAKRAVQNEPPKLHLTPIDETESTTWGQSDPVVEDGTIIVEDGELYYYEQPQYIFQDGSPADPRLLMDKRYGSYKALKDPKDPSKGWGPIVIVPRTGWMLGSQNFTKYYENPSYKSPATQKVEYDISIHTQSKEPAQVWGDYPKGYREKEWAMEQRWRREEERKHELALERAKKAPIVVHRQYP